MSNKQKKAWENFKFKKKSSRKRKAVKRLISFIPCYVIYHSNANKKNSLHFCSLFRSETMKISFESRTGHLSTVNSMCRYCQKKVSQMSVVRLSTVSALAFTDSVWRDDKFSDSLMRDHGLLFLRVPSKVLQLTIALSSTSKILQHTTKLAAWQARPFCSLTDIHRRNGLLWAWHCQPGKRDWRLTSGSTSYARTWLMYHCLFKFRSMNTRFIFAAAETAAHTIAPPSWNATLASTVAEIRLSLSRRQISFLPSTLRS